MTTKTLATFVAALSLFGSPSALSAVTRGTERAPVRRADENSTQLSADRVHGVRIASADLGLSRPGNRDTGELFAPWKVVSLFSEGQSLYTHHEGGPFGEYWITNPGFRGVESEVADFLRFNQQSSLTPYEASAMGRALSVGLAVRMWPQNGQLHTQDGAFTVGDRVDFANKYEGRTTGVVIAVNGNRLQVLTADHERVFRSYDVTRQEIARKVTSAFIDGTALAR